MKKLLLAALICTSGLQASALDYFYWGLFQAVPNYKASVAENKVHHGLGWEVAPLYFSFKPNRFVSPFSFFQVQPVNRMAGGLELFVESQLYPSSVPDAEQSFNWLHHGGLRLFYPLVAEGEVLGLLLGGRVAHMNNQTGFGVEAGLTTFYTLNDITFAYYFDMPVEYTISFNMRYF